MKAIITIKLLQNIQLSYCLLYTSKQGILLWEDADLNMTAHLNFMTGQRKEGLFTILLQLGDQGVYHANTVSYTHLDVYKRQVPFHWYRIR